MPGKRPVTPQPYFPRVGRLFPSPSPRGQGDIWDITNTDPVGKPKLLLSLFIKQTQFRFNCEPSRKFENFHRKPNVQCNTQTVP